jgi:hypothetical protein
LIDFRWHILCRSRSPYNRSCRRLRPMRVAEAIPRTPGIV